MKKVESLKQALKSQKDKLKQSRIDEADHNLTSILGNGKTDSLALPKGLSSFLQMGTSVSTLKGTLTKKKDKRIPVIPAQDDDSDSRSSLGPAMPPIAPSPRLKRFNSSTLSLHKNKKKLLTLEELYVEILYTILHMLGCDVEQEDQTKLVEHLKAAFHMEDEKHETLYDIACMKEEPCLRVNLEIQHAKHLIGKDMSGSSDPFCTFYLTTNPLSRYNTSYKPKTLDPVWNEEFALDVNSIEQDNLRVDVWDFNPEENVSDKFKKINEIKDARGLRKFIKETLNASTGKTSHELLGSVEIPLKDIPASGLDRYYPLEKPEAKTRRARGDIKVSMTLSTEKEPHVTAQEHRHLLKILFAHELQTCMAEPFTWNGQFTRESVTILAQHAVQGKLTGAETSLARWLVYCHTHCDLPLDYRVFLPILEKLSYALGNNLFHHDEECRFMEVAAVFVHHCVEFIKKHRQFVSTDAKHLIQLEYILRSLQVLTHCLEGKFEGEETFGLDESASRVLKNILSEVKEGVTQSIDDWYQCVLDRMPLETNRSLRTKTLAQLTHFLTQDLRDGCLPSHNLFKELLDIDYLNMAYEVYERELTELNCQFVEETCDKLKPVIFSEHSDNDYINDTMSLGTGLFELYLSLQRFVNFGNDLYAEIRSTEMANSHTWFNKAVARWLDIALYKAMQRIIRAVELDDLEPVDEFVKHSSSAVDIRTVLIQIKTFWKQLGWPDVEASYAFISKILDDVCKTTIFYADQMCRRVIHSQQPDRDGKFVVTPHLCLAINNIDYVLQYIRPFVEELGMDETLGKLEVLDGEMVANSCRRTLTTLVQNAVENVENKILEVLDLVGENMAPVIQKFLVEGSSLVAYAGRDKDTLINYLDKNLIMLKEKLNDTNFDRVLTVIWECSAQSLHDTIHLSIERRKPPSYFKTLLDILKVLINFFYGDKLPQDETLLKMKSLLQLYASDSTELISRYLWERHRDQRNVLEGEYTLGSITIRCQMLTEHLRVEVLNARHLKPPEIRTGMAENKYLVAARRRRLQSSLSINRSQRNLQWVKSKFKSLKSNLHEASLHFHNSANHGLCNPYVSLRLVPGQKFPDCPKHRTRTQQRTLFPLFDETFDFVLHRQSHSFHDTYLHVTVKDRGLMGSGIFLGEAFLPLDDIRVTNIDQRLSDMPQLQLPLTRPSHYDSDIILALDSRDFDRLAKDFLTKERRKL